jgi:hypothetical protein
MDRVMELERPWVEGNPRLEAARKEGVKYWRDHFGRVGLKEVGLLMFCGDFVTALTTLSGLLKYSSGQVLLLPWKYRTRILREIRTRLSKNSVSKRET